MPDEIPSISRSWDLPDDDRAAVLVEQATLPSDLVNPVDAVGDEEWSRAVSDDFMADGANALADFQYGWDWGMTPAQRASALADVALRREIGSFVDEASTFAAKPPVDPQEFAARTLERRAERARRL